MAPKVKLTYFNLRGRAEISRLLLAYGGIEYEDCRLTPGFEDPTEWRKLKPTTPFGTLPILEWNGTCIAQSITIARFIAGEVGLAGRNNLESAQADEVSDTISDLFNAMGKAMFSKDPEDMKKCMSETVPTTLALLEKRLCDRGGQYFAGNALTWADVYMYTLASGLPDQSCLEKCPKLKNLTSRVANIPNIKCWVEKRPNTKM